ncbi:hypothetical protein ANCDUO_00677 [Ancylostoma duodenale]|uniref:Uncharacterized protein n=1 Tax=Ancylostoma duodenale TaxID=51022 RepID=A0A0C2H558_9BILA|nr:hypothetical protein ANCDUO_00677 [Ancylostoma duodenale]
MTRKGKQTPCTPSRSLDRHHKTEKLRRQQSSSAGSALERQQRIKRPGNSVRNKLRRAERNVQYIAQTLTDRRQAEEVRDPYSFCRAEDTLHVEYNALRSAWKTQPWFKFKFCSMNTRKPCSLWYKTWSCIDLNEAIGSGLRACVEHY